MKLSYIILLIIVIFLGAALRFGSAYHAEKLAVNSQYSPFVFPDSINFYDYAINLQEMNEYVDNNNRHAWRTPGYSALLAAAMQLNITDIWSLRFINIILGCINIILVWLIGLKLFNSKAALLGAFFWAIYPFAIYINGMILADTLAVTAILLIIYFLLRVISDHEKRLPIILLGASLVLATMVKASFGLLIVPVTFWLLIVTQKNRLRCTCLLLLTFIICITPWWIRNYQQFRTFVPFSTMGGFTLYEATGPGADGGPNHGKVKFPAGWHRFQKNIKEGLSIFEPAADKGLYKKSFEIMQSDPERTLKLSLNKIKRTWSPTPNWQGAQQPLYIYAMALSYTPIVFFALLGIIVFRRRWQKVYILFIPLAYLFVVHAVFMGSIRYRLPGIAPLCIIAAACIVHFVSKFSHKHLKNN